MRSDSSIAEIRIAGFLDSVWPEALLYLPGCRTLGVNRSHVKRFPATRGQLVENSLQVREILDQSRDEAAGERCHCEDTFALEALRPSDCTPEKLFLRTLESKAPEAGLQLRRERQNGSREYGVDYVVGELLDPTFTHVMHYRFAREYQARVSVITTDPVSLERHFRLLFGSGVLIEASDCPVLLPNEEPYTTVHTVIDKALSITLSDGPAIARQFLRKKTSELSSVEYLQHRVILQKLSATPDELLCERLMALRERLIDVPVLSKYEGQFEACLRAAHSETRLPVTTILAASAAEASEATTEVVDLTSKVERDRYLDYALESVNVLSIESLREAAATLGDDIALLPERALVRRLRREIKILYAKDPARLVQFDKILDTLENKELQAKGWILSESEQSDSLREHQHSV